MYVELCRQTCDILEVEFKEAVYQAYFFELIESLWPKYLQAFFYDMAKALKCKVLELEEDEFEDLPLSTFDSLPNYEHFEDFCHADL